MTQNRPIDAERGKRIRQVRKEFLGLNSQEEFAERISTQGNTVSRGAVGNWEQGKEIGLKNLRAICDVAGVSFDWLSDGIGEPFMSQPAATEEQAPTRRPKPNASFPPKYQTFDGDGYVPLLGQTIGGPNGRFILNGAEVGRLFVPPMLEGVEGAYGVRVYGTSMEPRYVAGETVWLNPHEPVRQGDDVVVQIVTDEENGRESYIKKFISRSSRVTRLWQHNPDEGEKNEIEFDTDRVFSIHKIVFHATV